MSGREGSIGTGGIEVDVPEAGTCIAFANDGGDAGNNGADVVFVEKNIVTAMIAKLSKREESFAGQSRVDGSLAGSSGQRDREVGKV
jgi:hypothetical protein